MLLKLPVRVSSCESQNANAVAVAVADGSRSKSLGNKYFLINDDSKGGVARALLKDWCQIQVLLLWASSL